MDRLAHGEVTTGIGLLARRPLSRPGLGCVGLSRTARTAVRGESPQTSSARGGATRWAATASMASGAEPPEAGASQQPQAAAQAPEPSAIVVQAFAPPAADNATRNAARAIQGLRWRGRAEVMVIPETMRRSDMSWTLWNSMRIWPSRTR